MLIGADAALQTNIAPTDPLTRSVRGDPAARRRSGEYENCVKMQPELAYSRQTANKDREAQNTIW
ncbi:MAG: hypothetical protein WDN46_04870 [Methylocella sp.]